MTAKIDIQASNIDLANALAISVEETLKANGFTNVTTNSDVEEGAVANSLYDQLRANNPDVFGEEVEISAYSNEPEPEVTAEDNQDGEGDEA